MNDTSRNFISTGDQMYEFYQVFLISQGFGVSAKTTAECRHTDPMTIILFHQADIGEYLRNEESLT